MKATQQAPSDMAIKCDAAIPVVIVPEIVSVETQQHSKDNGIVTQPVPESFVNKMSNNNMNLDFLTEQKSNDPRRSSPTHSSSNVSQLEQELLSDLKVPETEASVRSVFEGDKILQTLLSNANISSRPSAAPPPPPPLTLSNGFKSSNGSQLHDMSPASTAEIPDGISSSLASDKRNNPSATCKVLGMSAEAAQILDELPILSFLRSNLT